MITTPSQFISYMSELGYFFTAGCLPGDTTPRLCCGTDSLHRGELLRWSEAYEMGEIVTLEGGTLVWTGIPITPEEVAELMSFEYGVPEDEEGY